MTAYNRLNGRWCTEAPELLAGLLLRVLRRLRGHRLVRGGRHGRARGRRRRPGRCRGRAGPSAPRWRRPCGPARSTRAGDAQVTRLLSVFDRLGALDGGDPGDDVSTDAPEHRAVARRAATESMVLLANDGLLPLDRTALRTVAIVGPNAASPDHGRGLGLAAGHPPGDAGGGADRGAGRGRDRGPRAGLRQPPQRAGAGRRGHGRSRPRPARARRRLVRQPRPGREPVHHSHTRPPTWSPSSRRCPGWPPADGRCGPTPWSRPPSRSPTRSR